MDFNFLNRKEEQNNRGKKPKAPGNFSGSIVGVLFIFMLITASYLVISEEGKKVPEVSISDLAQSVARGDITRIVVAGDKLTITYKNDEVKIAKKEIGSTLSQTLFNYGVTGDALSKTQIEIKDESGFMF